MYMTNMEFRCTPCNYISNDKFNYHRHLKTKKHLIKCNVSDNEYDKEKLHEHICQYCLNKYTTASNLAKHRSICSEKKELIDKINNLSGIVEQKDEIISVLKSENSNLKTMLNGASSLIKTSVSSMAYIFNNYKNAPALESINNCALLNHEQNNTEIIETLIYEYGHNRLSIYIGDFIIKFYKKDDPSQQSIWNSDVNRLTYLLREIIANNKVDWYVDKKGIRTSECIIKPILEYIEEQIKKYLSTFNADCSNLSFKQAEKKMLSFKAVSDILKSIQDKKLHADVLRYMAPYFYLNKNDNLLE